MEHKKQMNTDLDQLLDDLWIIFRLAVIGICATVLVIYAINHWS